MLSKSIKKWSIRKEKSWKRRREKSYEKNLNNHFRKSFEEKIECDIVNYHWFG